VAALLLAFVYRPEACDLPVWNHRVDGSNLLAAGASVEVVDSWAGWAEGPLWVASATSDKSDESFLIYSERATAQLRQWSPRFGERPHRARAGVGPSISFVTEGQYEGTSLDPNGRLLLCDRTRRQIVRCERRSAHVVPEWDGEKTVLVSGVDGKRLNGPADLAMLRDGSFLFTDPPNSLPVDAADKRPGVHVSGIYEWKDGNASLLFSAPSERPGPIRPHAIALSADETKVYVTDTDPHSPVVVEFTRRDGKLDDGRIFAKLEGPVLGALEVDSAGNLYIGTARGISVHDASGKWFSQLYLGEQVTGLGWGGLGCTELYITTSRHVFRVRMRTAGACATRHA
jgi:gluconolactonase